MPSNWLTVPHLRQSEDGFCLEACVCMLLAYWQNPVTEAKVSELLQGTPFGTPGGRVLRLKRWGYHVIYRSATLKEVADWLAQQTPVIALVKTDFLTYWMHDTRHAVVVVGIDEQSVYLTDPAFDDAP